MDPMLAEFERIVLAEIPLARAMQLRAAACHAHELVLAAPLAPNVNDKGCAFGGSLASLLTLAGWGLIVLHLRRRGLDCDVYVQDSQMRYLAPVWQDFTAHAVAATGESWADFDQALDTRGKARLRVHCRVPLPDGGDACTLEARFVALTKR